LFAISLATPAQVLRSDAPCRSFGPGEAEYIDCTAPRWADPGRLPLAAARIESGLQPFDQSSAGKKMDVLTFALWVDIGV
jgi:hypothetical protein